MARASAQDTKGIDESTLIKLMVSRESFNPLSSLGDIPAEAVLSLRGIGCKSSGVHDVNIDLLL